MHLNELYQSRSLSPVLLRQIRTVPDLEGAEEVQQGLAAADVLRAALEAALDDREQVRGRAQDPRLVRVLHRGPRLLAHHLVQLLTEGTLFGVDIHPAGFAASF